MNETVTDALLRGAAHTTEPLRNLFNHATALAREAETKAHEAANDTATPVRVAYPPMVLLLAKSTDQIIQNGDNE